MKPFVGPSAVEGRCLLRRLLSETLASAFHDAGASELPSLGASDRQVDVKCQKATSCSRLAEGVWASVHNHDPHMPSQNFEASQVAKPF